MRFGCCTKIISSLSNRSPKVHSNIDNHPLSTYYDKLVYELPLSRPLLGILGSFHFNADEPNLKFLVF